MNLQQNMDGMVSDVKDYEEFVQPYQYANSMVNVWLESLAKDFQGKYNHNPIHNIQSRIKSLESILKKLSKKDAPHDFGAAMDYLTDIAGTRVICFFVQDVYTIADLLKKQLDTVVIKECDYIKNPKPNGYRSFHLVLGITVFQSTGKQYFPVEIQIRTLAMDFWASMEHKLCYKKLHQDNTTLTWELKEYANMLGSMEKRMEKFYDLPKPN